MIVENQKQATVYTDGEDIQDQIEMSLDLDSAQILMQMLSKDLYADAIGSTIREVVSNALDSHREAKTTKPIIVGFKRNVSNNYEFTVEDFGTGLDNDDVNKIISKYGKSTRRQNATALGMMGLGFKSPLSYCSSFIFITRKNGIERKYMMYESEYTNMIDLLSELPTDEPNGLKVIIPVNSEDREMFYKKIKEQLCYFEDVYFDVNVDGRSINNSFNILRSEHFQVSELSNFEELHICLDNVYYPINFNNLGIKHIYAPIGLRFTLSEGLYPVPNRESLVYNENAKKIILAKIAKVADIIIEDFNKYITTLSTFNEVFTFYNINSKCISIAGKVVDTKDFISYSTLPIETPKIPGIELLDLRIVAKASYMFAAEYRIVYRVNSQKISKAKYNNIDHWDYSDIRNSQVFIMSDRLSAHKREYIKTLIKSYNSYIITKKDEPIPLMPDKNASSYARRRETTYYSMLNLSSYPKNQWRQVITEFQILRKEVLSNFIDLDDLIIPQDWLDAKKQMKIKSISKFGGVKKTQKREGQISCKVAETLERYVDNQNCKFVGVHLNIADLEKFPKLTVYDTHDKKAKLDEIFQISNKLRLITLSNRELKVVEDLNIHNLISYTEFMKGENKLFKRIVTAYLIKELMYSNNNLFNNLNSLSLISKDLSDKLRKLSDYVRLNYEAASSLIYQAMLEIAESNNSFDGEIYHIYKEVKITLDNHRFLDLLMPPSNYKMDTKEGFLTIISDLCKYHKYRMNSDRYAVKLNEKKVDETTKDEVN